MKTVLKAFFFLFFVILASVFLHTNAYAYDYCHGNVNGEQQVGICFYGVHGHDNTAYATDIKNACIASLGTCNTVPDCTTITEGNTSYTEIPSSSGCLPTAGTSLRCCAPQDKSLLKKAPPTCVGYQQGNNLAQNGVCFYYTSNYSPNYTVFVSDADFTASGYNFPSCSEMAQNTFGDSNYHGITDSVRACPAGLGAPIKCCAPNNQTAPAAPPPPCTLDSKGNCTSVTTALGPINIDVASVVGTIFSILLSLSGGIALLLIAFNGYVIMTSGGDAEKLKGAREAITAAIIGLVFMIFSVIILKIIGVDVLRIPDFLGHR